MLLSFLEILKFLSTQFSVVHRGVVDIFCNSPLASKETLASKELVLSDCVIDDYAKDGGLGEV